MGQILVVDLSKEEIRTLEID
ncbi:MAG: hypothetical protein ThorAB25_27360, partial [Candidatus Thorarchaeota archaeon AB_25]